MLYLQTSGQGGPGDAQWDPSLTSDEEFGIFDQADQLNLADEDGNLFGIAFDRSGNVRMIGTWKQQLAKFPFAAAGQPWHGYPFWPIETTVASSRRRQHWPKVAMVRFIAAGLLTATQATRLRGGKHV